jgi:1,3-propanediol dehydrogenase
MEAFVSKNANPISDLYARESIRLAFENIRRAVSHGTDLLARSNMLLAGLLSSKAINIAGVGAIHALSDPISGRYNIGHGLALSLILPEVVEYNLDSNFEKYACFGKLLGENIDGMTAKKAAQKLVEAIEKLLVELGLNKRLRDFGITQNDIEFLAPEAVNPDMECNPKKLNIEDIKAIYRKAL